MRPAESIVRDADAEGRFIQQAEGRGQYAVVQMRVEPFANNGRIAFRSAAMNLPEEFVKAVEAGMRNAAQEGLHGTPLVDIKVTLLGAREHPVDSSKLAFENAGGIAFRQAVQEAGTVSVV
jgi:elongation factor G